MRQSADTPSVNPFTLAKIPTRFATACSASGQVFVGTQVALEDSGAVHAPRDMPAQTRVILSNIRQALEPLGADLTDVIKLNTYYVGRDRAQEALEARGEFFHDGPVSTGVGAASAGPEGVAIAIEAVAAPGAHLTFARGSNDYGYVPDTLPFRVIGHANDLGWIAGVSATAQSGATMAPGDVHQQIELTLDVLRRRLGAIDAAVADLALIRSYWSAECPDLPDLIAQRDRGFDRPIPTVDLVIPGFPSTELLLEMDVVALTTAPSAGHQPGSRCVRRGADGLAYTGLHTAKPTIAGGSLGDEMHAALDELRSSLATSDSDLERLVLLHVYYTQDVTWREVAETLAATLGVDTAISLVGVVRIGPTGGHRVGIDAIAV